MSDDWARKYIDIHKQRQQEKQDAQERGRLARAAAPEVFQRIKDRIKQDVQTFHDAGVLKGLEFTEVSGASFSVVDKTPRTKGSRPALIVDLEMILVRYHYLFPGREREDRTLRISADLEGITQVYKNGDALADEAEISEFLLRPLLDRVDSVDNK